MLYFQNSRGKSSSLKVVEFSQVMGCVVVGFAPFHRSWWDVVMRKLVVACNLKRNGWFLVMYWSAAQVLGSIRDSFLRSWCSYFCSGECHVNF